LPAFLAARDATARIEAVAISSNPRDARTSGGQDHRDCGSVASSNVAAASVIDALGAALDLPETKALVAEIDAARWTGRPGYPTREKRAAVEREFGRLKTGLLLSPLRVRTLERVRLHVNLTMLARLSCALARARAVPLAA